MDGELDDLENLPITGLMPLMRQLQGRVEALAAENAALKERMRAAIQTRGPVSQAPCANHPSLGVRIWRCVLSFFLWPIRRCLPGVILVLIVWVVHDLISPPWINAGAVHVSGNLAVELERQSITLISNEYARKLTVHQITPYRKLGSFPLMIDTGGHTWILLYRFTGPEGQPCLLVNDGNEQWLDLKSGRKLGDGSLMERPKDFDKDLLYIGAWDGWKFCPTPILSEQEARTRSRRLSERGNPP